MMHDVCVLPSYVTVQESGTFGFHTVFGHISRYLHSYFCVAWLPLVTWHDNQLDYQLRVP